MDDLGFGLAVSLVGMATVFGVLVLLWALLALVGRWETRPVPRTSAPAAPVPRTVRVEGAGRRLDPRLVAAISVAVLRHAETRRRQAAPAMRSYWPGSQLFASRWVAAGRTRQGQTWTRRR